MLKKQFSDFSFQNFFRILSENFFRLSAKNLQKVVKTTFCVTRGTICWLKYFLKVLNRFGFSAKIFGMVLKFLYTCPEWNLRKKKFFFSFFPSEFSGFWAKIFSDFWPKNVNNLSKLTSTRLRGTICGLKYFFESFKSFWIFCRNLWNGSQVSIYVSRVKFAEETVCWFFSSDFFSDFEWKFFQTFGEKSSKSCQN